MTDHYICVTMQAPLKSVIYVSRAREGLTDAEVFEIYRAALDANALEGVTGLLIYDGAVFVQIVEGSENSLQDLLGRLRHDNRHQAVNIIDDRDIEVRSFGTWSMKLLRVNRAHMEGVAAAEELMGPGVRPDIRAMLLSVISRMEELA